MTADTLPFAGQFALGLVFAALCSIGLFGNILVCVAVYANKKLRKKENLYFVSLSIADLLVAILVMPFAAFNDLLGRWLFGLEYCKIWMCLDIMLCTASNLHLCAISFDRYYHIHDSLRYRERMTPRKILLAILLVWILSALIAFTPLLFEVENEQFFFGHISSTLAAADDLESAAVNNSTGIGHPHSYCRFNLDPFYAIVSSTVSFYVPCVLMTLAYAKLYKYARHHALSIWLQQMTTFLVQVHQVMGDDHNHTGRKWKKRAAKGATGGGAWRKDRKARVTLGAVMGAFICAWLPFFVFNIAKSFCGSVCVPNWLFATCTWMGYANSSQNPILYSIFNRDFRRAFRRILGLEKRKDRGSVVVVRGERFKDPLVDGLDHGGDHKKLAMAKSDLGGWPLIPTADQVCANCEHRRSLDAKGSHEFNGNVQETKEEEPNLTRKLTKSDHRSSVVRKESSQEWTTTVNPLTVGHGRPLALGLAQKRLINMGGESEDSTSQTDQWPESSSDVDQLPIRSSSTSAKAKDTCKGGRRRNLFTSSLDQARRLVARHGHSHGQSTTPADRRKSEYQKRPLAKGTRHRWSLIHQTGRGEQPSDHWSLFNPLARLHDLRARLDTHRGHRKSLPERSDHRVVLGGTPKDQRRSLGDEHGHRAVVIRNGSLETDHRLFFHDENGLETVGSQSDRGSLNNNERQPRAANLDHHPSKDDQTDHGPSSDPFPCIDQFRSVRELTSIDSEDPSPTDVDPPPPPPPPPPASTIQIDSRKGKVNIIKVYREWTSI